MSKGYKIESEYFFNKQESFKNRILKRKRHRHSNILLNHNDINNIKI